MIKRRKATEVSLEREEEFGVVGCLGVLVVAVLVGVGVFVASRLAGPRLKAEREKAEAPALTRVAPDTHKMVVRHAVKERPLATRVATGSGTPPSAAKAAPGVMAAVAGLGNIGPSTPLPAAERGAEAAALTKMKGDRTLCRDGHPPHRGKSLYSPDGFAVDYGSDDLNSGNPYPRLEVYFDRHDGKTFASYISLGPPVAGFSSHETPVANNADAIGRVIARWVAATATAPCPLPTKPANKVGATKAAAVAKPAP